VLKTEEFIIIINFTHFLSGKKIKKKKNIPQKSTMRHGNDPFVRPSIFRLSKNKSKAHAPRKYFKAGLLSVHRI
jgi:hypothetical protein